MDSLKSNAAGRIVSDRIRLAGFLMLVAALFSSGCVQFYQSFPVTVTVRDGDTGAPLPDAKIQVDYRVFLIPCLNRPSDFSVQTDKNGKANFSSTSFMYEFWRVSAPEYLDRNSGPELMEIQHIPLKNSLDIPLFLKPEPTLTLIVPDNYHGLVRIALHRSTRPSGENAHQRNFEYEVPLNGLVDRSAPPVLLDEWIFTTIRVKYANGSLVPKRTFNSPTNEIILRSNFHEFLASPEDDDVRRYVLVIGNQQDDQEIQSKVYTPDGHGGGEFNQQNFDALFEDKTPR